MIYQQPELKNYDFIGQRFDINMSSHMFQATGTYISTCILWRNRYRSSLHYARATASFGSKSQRLALKTPITYELKGWPAFKKWLVRIGGHRSFIEIFSWARTFLFNKKLGKLLFQSKMKLSDYRYICVPYSGLLSSEFDDLVNYFRSQDSRVVAIQENWDNLSSKTFVNSRPNYFLTWGKQSSGQVRFLHQLNDVITFEIGSPRFLPYQSPQLMAALEEEIKSKFTHLSDLGDYVFVTGTGDGLDDSFVLEATFSVLEELKEEGKKYSLVFRPHPYTRNRMDEVKKGDFCNQGIIFDDTHGASSVFHHCPIVSGASLVINQFSTILLEAVAASTKVLLPTFISRPSTQDYSTALDEWLHFLGISILNNVHLAFSIPEYKDALKKALLSPTFKEDVDRVSWFIAALPTGQALLNFDYLFDSFESKSV